MMPDLLATGAAYTAHRFFLTAQMYAISDAPAKAAPLNIFHGHSTDGNKLL